VKKRYGPYQTKFGHLFWVDTYDDGSRRSVWVHREMMETHLGRKLGDDEVVHHKNEQPADNRIDNFEIKTRADHTRDHQDPPEMMEIECPQCHALVFVRAARQRHNQQRQGKAGPFCSKSCAGRWTRLRQIDAGLVNLRA
jgi:endogenous inhibitor of DNA gyrase (YacG/DUF329 family)